MQQHGKNGNHTKTGNLIVSKWTDEEKKTECNTHIIYLVTLIIFVKLLEHIIRQVIGPLLYNT